MMMRYATISKDMKEAMFRFCMEQGTANGRTSAEEVKKLVDTAFEIFNKIPYSGIIAVPIYRYTINAGEKFTDEIFPVEVKNNGIICERCVILGTIMLDSYSAENDNGKNIIRGYDVVYDPDSKTVKLYYRLMVSDDSVITLYRVETDVYEDFDVYEFMLEVTSQISGKLRQSLFVPVSENGIANSGGIPAISIMEVC